MSLPVNRLDLFNRLMLSVLLLLVWTGVAHSGAGTVVIAANAPALSDDSTPAQLHQHADALDQQLMAFQQVDDELPRDTFDPTAIVKLVGPDPDKLFAWVRDNTAFVPYRGVLRGPVGVLLDRNGNSADRSCLLLRLLQIAGIPVRLARGELTGEQADTLLKQTWEDPKSAAPARPEVDADDTQVARIAGILHIEPQSLQGAMEQRNLVFEKHQEDLVASVTETMQRLTSLMPVPQAPDPSIRVEQVNATTDHWWVQRQLDGKWTDLDTARRDSNPGESLTKATKFIEVKAGQPAIESADWHQVELRIVVERWQPDGVKRSVALKTTLRPAELNGRPTTLAISALGPPLDADPGADNAAEQIRNGLLKQNEWLPVLSTAGNATIQGSFNDHGKINPKPNLDALAALGGALGGGIGKIGALLGGEEPPADTGVLTSVALEMEVHAPKASAKIFSRSLFDFYGPVLRGPSAATDLADAQSKAPELDDNMKLERVTSMNGRIDFMIAGGTLSREFISHLAMRSLQENGPKVVKAMRVAETDPLKKSFDELSTANPLPTALLVLAADRGGLGNLTPCIVDRLNLLALHTTLVRSGDAMRIRQTTDIIANHTSPRGAVANAYSARMHQGVVETALEALVLPGGSRRANAASLFAAADAQKIDWVTIRDAADPAFARLRIDPDLRVRLSTDLRAGYAVIAPTKEIFSNGVRQTGWWRIDPRDGTCVGMMHSGMGAASVDYGMLLMAVVNTAFTTLSCGGFAKGASKGKRLGCAVCGVLSGVLTYFGGAGLHGGGGLAGTAASGAKGFGAGQGLNAVCAVVSAGLD